MLRGDDTGCVVKMKYSGAGYVDTTVLSDADDAIVVFNVFVCFDDYE